MSAATIEAIPLSAKCICGDVRLDHKMGKGVCKVTDCGCDAYEQLDGLALVNPTEPVEGTESTSAALRRVEQERDALREARDVAQESLRIVTEQRVSLAEQLDGAEKQLAHMDRELEARRNLGEELEKARAELEQLRNGPPDAEDNVLAQAEATGVPRIVKAAEKIRDLLDALTGDVMDHAREARLRAEQTRLEARLTEIRKELNPRRTDASGVDSKAVRAWAKANNVECPDVGRVPNRVLDAYHAATPKTP
jgi:chromosome segregation ATPase